MANPKGRRPAGGAGRKRTEAEMSPATRYAWEWVKSLAVALVLFLVIRTFLVQSFYITSGSMIPSLLVGDFLMVSRAAYGAQIPLTDARLPGYTEIRRGDIVVFEGPHQPELDLVKRLVGLPGDTLEMRDGTLIVNGSPPDEPYVQRLHPDLDETHPWMTWQRRFLAPGVDPAAYAPTVSNWGPIVVPPATYFMLGDNRDESLDSRFWGPVPEELIKGEALFLYYSYDATSPQAFPWLTRIRWNRIGDIIR